MGTSYNSGLAMERIITRSSGAQRLQTQKADRQVSMAVLQTVCLFCVKTSRPPAHAFYHHRLVNRSPMCISATNNADGASVVLAECRRFTDTAPANQSWVYATEPLSGPIKTYGGTKCLDVPNGDATNGNHLQIWSCVEGSTNQQWKRRTPFPNLTIEWVGKNKCIAIANDNMTVGTPVRHLRSFVCARMFKGSSYLGMSSSKFRTVTEIARTKRGGISISELAIRVLEGRSCPRPESLRSIINSTPGQARNCPVRVTSSVVELLP